MDFRPPAAVQPRPQSVLGPSVAPHGAPGEPPAPGPGQPLAPFGGWAPAPSPRLSRSCDPQHAPACPQDTGPLQDWEGVLWVTCTASGVATPVAPALDSVGKDGEAEVDSGGCGCAPRAFGRLPAVGARTVACK